MALKWKTTITYHNYLPPPEEVKAEILDQCAQWQAAGVYTGGSTMGIVPDNPADFYYHRWWWSTEAQASAYVEFVELAWPGNQKTIDISSEDVPE